MNIEKNEFHHVPVVILCGGKGVMLNEKQSQRVNKGLIEIQNKPLFYRVIQHYALHGATEFILSIGFQYELFGPALETLGAKVHAGKSNNYEATIAKKTCHISLVQTAPEATTSERLLACKSLIGNAENFAVTYSDTLSNVDLSEEMRFHKRQKLVATLVAAKFPVRFRILGIRAGESLVRAFASRPVIEAASINGGFYIFTKALWNDCYSLEKQVALENQPLERLASAGQLIAFQHNGTWQNCDAERDLTGLSELAKYFDSSESAQKS